MKSRAVIESATRELLEIGDVVRRDVRIKFYHHHAFARSDDGDFVRIRNGRCGVRGGNRVGGRRSGGIFIGTTGGEQQSHRPSEK